ncbi:MAG: hypothetical protein HUJ91_06930, partial [Bacteroidales bacterium]|nr:hypothetical protein [Bacteroidales bacterium]
MESEEKLRKIVIALIIAIGILAVAFVSILVSKNRLVGDLKVEKADLTEQMVQLKSDYAELQTSNDTLNAQLEVEREKVDQMIERLKKTEATNRAQIKKYEAELGTMRSIMRHYIVQID